MGNDQSLPSCQNFITTNRPLCNHGPKVDWVNALKSKNPCGMLDTFLAEPQECVGNGGCPLHYTATGACDGGGICIKNDITQNPHFSDVELNDNARKMLCCASNFEKGKCESQFCGPDASGCPGLMQRECATLGQDYPKDRNTMKVTNIDLSKVNQKTDKNKYIFAYQDYPSCGCYDTDAQEFESRRRGVKVASGGSDTQLSVAMSVPPSCWFGPCRNPYIYGPTPSCSQSISVCLQDNEIEYGNDSSQNTVNLRNDCGADASVSGGDSSNAGTGTSSPDSTSEEESDFLTEYLWIIIAVLILMCCCCGIGLVLFLSK